MSAFIIANILTEAPTVALLTDSECQWILFREWERNGYREQHQWC